MQSRPRQSHGPWGSTRCTHGTARASGRSASARRRTPRPWDEVARGYEAPDGRVVILSDTDLADLSVPTAPCTIDVIRFVPAGDVDPLLLDRAYYLSADGPAGRPYRLLRDALAENGLVGVARWVLRTRESLALLRVRDDVLVIHTLLWPEEVRPTSGLAPEVPAPDLREMEMARTLLEQLTAEFRLGGAARRVPARAGAGRPGRLADTSRRMRPPRTSCRARSSTSWPCSKPASKPLGHPAPATSGGGEEPGSHRRGYSAARAASLRPERRRGSRAR